MWHVLLADPGICSELYEDTVGVASATVYSSVHVPHMGMPVVSVYGFSLTLVIGLNMCAD